MKAEELLEIVNQRRHMNHFHDSGQRDSRWGCLIRNRPLTQQQQHGANLLSAKPAGMIQNIRQIVVLACEVPLQKLADLLQL